jgi:hypothetical protein
MSEHKCQDAECRFCQSKGEYFDFDEDGIYSICKRHLRLEASS